MSFAQGFQAGLAGVQQFQKIRDDKRKRKEEADAKAFRQEVADAKVTTGLGEAQKGLSQAVDAQGRPLIRMLGQPNEQGQQRFEQLDVNTGKYVTDADNVIDSKGLGNYFLGKRYDEAPTADQQAVLKREAIVNQMMVNDPEKAVSYQKALQDIEASKAGVGLTTARTEQTKTQTEIAADAAQANLNNVNARTQATLAGIDNDAEKLGLSKAQLEFAKTKFGKEFEQSNVKIANQASQFAQRFGIDQAKLDEVIAQNLRSYAIQAAQVDQGQQRIDQAGEQFEANLGIKQAQVDQGQQRIDLTAEQYEHQAIMGMADFSMKEKQFQLDQLEFGLRQDESSARVGLTNAQTEQTQARIAQLQGEVKTIADTKSGVKLSYLGDSFKTGNNDMANQLMDENLPLIRQSIRPPEGVGEFADIDIVDKDGTAFTVAFKDAEGNRLGTRVMDYDYLDNQANILQGKANDGGNVTQLINYRKSLQQTIANSMEEPTQEQQAQLARVDAQLAQQLGGSTADVPKQIQAREYNLKYRQVDPTYRAVLNRKSLEVIAYDMNGNERRFPSLADYNATKAGGVLDVPTTGVGNGR